MFGWSDDLCLKRKRTTFSSLDVERKAGNLHHSDNWAVVDRIVGNAGPRCNFGRDSVGQAREFGTESTHRAQQLPFGHLEIEN